MYFMKAVIYSPTKSAMQSGLRNTKFWWLEFMHDGSRYIEPLMGWTGSCDMQQELRLRFKNKDEAIKYAKANNIIYKTILPQYKKNISKSYSDNFISNRSEIDNDLIKASPKLPDKNKSSLR